LYESLKLVDFGFDLGSAHPGRDCFVLLGVEEEREEES
jgi:hypothetical protein